MSTAKDFADVKALAVTALRNAVTTAKSVEPLAGQLEDAMDGRVANFPLLTVAFSEGTFEPVDGPVHYRQLSFTVGIFVHSMKGIADLDLRADEMIRAVEDCLVNARLATNIEGVSPKATRLVYASNTVQVYAFDFSVGMDQTFQWIE